MLTQISFVLVAAGAALILLARQAAEIPQTQLQIGWLLCLAGIALAYVQVRKWALRQYAKRSIRRSKLPPEWRVSFESDQLVGSADVFLSTPDGNVRYALAIARWKGVTVKRTLIMRRQQLVNLKGSRIRARRLRTLTDQCALAKWYPVLWLPSARMAPVFILDDGLMVIQGGPRELRAALAPRGL